MNIEHPNQQFRSYELRDLTSLRRLDERELRDLSALVHEPTRFPRGMTIGTFDPSILNTNPEYSDKITLSSVPEFFNISMKHATLISRVCKDGFRRIFITAEDPVGLSVDYSELNCTEEDKEMFPYLNRFKFLNEGETAVLSSGTEINFGRETKNKIAFGPFTFMVYENLPTLTE